jgi:hypothetical protein
LRARFVSCACTIDIVGSAHFQTPNQNRNLKIIVINPGLKKEGFFFGMLKVKVELLSSNRDCNIL